MQMNIQKEVDLSSANSLRLKCIARQFVEIHSLTDMEAFLSKYLQHSNQQRIFILGEGSNVILPEYFSGIVLRPKLFGIRVVEESEDAVLVKVFAGENWHDFVQYTIKNSYYGLENLSLIPGSVGAAPIQNIGAYGVEVCEYIESLEVYDFINKENKILTSKECQFSYRDSLFKQTPDRYLILAVNFRLSKNEQLNLTYKVLRDVIDNKMQSDKNFELNQKSLSQTVCDIRSEKLPDIRKIANAGSFFKNPVVSTAQYQELKIKFPEIVAYPQKNSMWKLSAAWLIERCGWKGKVSGNLGIYPKHALVLITLSQSCQQEVLTFAAGIQLEIKNTFSVDLEIEPVLVA